MLESPVDHEKAEKGPDGNHRSHERDLRRAMIEEPRERPDRDRRGRYGRKAEEEQGDGERSEQKGQAGRDSLLELGVSGCRRRASPPAGKSLE